MIRLLIFLLIIAGLGFGFSWIANNPGTVVVEWGGTEIEVSLMIAAIGILVVFFGIMLVWSVIRAILKSPVIFGRFFRERRKERGYRALSNGLISASAGNSADARRYTKESSKLLGKLPVVKLLEVQTSMLEGNTEKARNTYTEMLGSDETRQIALRGLYLEAEKEGNGEIARQYAEEAAKTNSALPWASTARLRFQCMEGDWEGAIRTLEANRSAGLVTKEEAGRKRAVLLTAQAYSEEKTNPALSIKLAQQALKLAPDLVPAAVIGAQANIRQNKVGPASKMIESVWKRNPHPELTEIYLHARHGDSVQDRLKRARHLAKIKTNHSEGNIAIAEAAIDALDWDEARKAMEPVLRNNLSERACLIMADIEEGEHGNRGRMREWLSRAVRAPRDAAWTANGYVSEKWMPISPVTGEIDAFEWKVPVERLAGPDDQAKVIDIDELVKPLPEENADELAIASSVAATSVAASGAATGAAGVIDADEDSSEDASSEEIVIEAESPEVDAKIVEAENSASLDDAKSDAVPLSQEGAQEGAQEGSQTAEQSGDENAEGDNNSVETEEVEAAPTPVSDLGDQDADEESSGEASLDAKQENDDQEDSKGAEDENIFALDHRPDDPGVNPDAVVVKKRKWYQLF